MYFAAFKMLIKTEQLPMLGNICNCRARELIAQFRAFVAQKYCGQIYTSWVGFHTGNVKI